MSLEQLTRMMLPEVEKILMDVVYSSKKPGLAEMIAMLAYHMGWEGEGAGPEARGKRIRPLLVLLSAASTGADWQPALPAAAAVELLHNFSLVHDDIQDQSPLRRGRPTVWNVWGVPQAINAGDTLFTLAHLALLRLSETRSEAIVIEGMKILDQACLALTQGQYLDISYEKRVDLTLEDYWPMIDGKTAALLSCCTELGALAAEAGAASCARYADFGRYLGLAFQALDDMLGIWGDEALTGKSAESDLVAGKKTLPVLYGLGLNGAFAGRWREGNIRPDEVPWLAAQLEREGGKAYTRKCANELTENAVNSLKSVNPDGEAGSALLELSMKLLRRKM